MEMPDTVKGKRLEAKAMRSAAMSLLDRARVLDTHAARQEDDERERDAPYGNCPDCGYAYPFVGATEPCGAGS